MTTLGKRLRAPSTYHYIPDEILFFNILNRLPAQSLVRFKSVSKHWNAMIEDPEFIQSQSVLAKQKSSVVGLVQIKRKGTKVGGREYFFVPKESLTHFHIQTSKPASIVGICNGLICFRSRLGLEICNPCTGEFLYLPFPRRPPPYHVAHYGFCYDPLKNEYKVIQIAHGNQTVNFNRCMVYTFGSDNDTWQDITAKSNLWRCLDNVDFNKADGLQGVVNEDRAVHSKGALYWFIHSVAMIMSFDIHNEKFGLIEPPRAKLSKGVKLYIAEWQGCMCLTFQTRLRNGVRIFTYMSDASQDLDHSPNDVQNWSELVVPIGEKYTKLSTIGLLGGDSRLLYWFSDKYVTFYSPEEVDHQRDYEPENETRERFQLPRGVDHSMVTDYEFMHHIESSLSLKALLPPSVLDQDGRIKTYCPLQVRSSSFL